MKKIDPLPDTLVAEAFASLSPGAIRFLDGVITAWITDTEAGRGFVQTLGSFMRAKEGLVNLLHHGGAQIVFDPPGPVTSATRVSIGLTARGQALGEFHNANPEGHA